MTIKNFQLSVLSCCVLSVLAPMNTSFAAGEAKYVFRTGQAEPESFTAPETPKAAPSPNKNTPATEAKSSVKSPAKTTSNVASKKTVTATTASGKQSAFATAPSDSSSNAYKAPSRPTKYSGLNPAYRPVSSSAVATSPAPAREKTPSSANQTISLSTGFQEIIDLPKLPTRVAIGDPDVAEVTVLKPNKKGENAGVLVVGKQAGSTSLLIWNDTSAPAKSYTIAVTGKTGPSTGDVKGLKLDTKGNISKLSGSVSNVAAYQQVRNGLSKTDLVDTTTITVPGTVQVDVRVVEFSRNELQRAGISFNKTNGKFNFGVSNPATTASSSSSSVSQAFQLVAKRFDPLDSTRTIMETTLSMLESDGYAKVLAEPTLVAQSGQSASFLAGGEVPIPVPSGSAGTSSSFSILYKTFGIKLDFTPTILNDKTIALKVSPEVSDLDFSKGITVNGFQVPAITTRRADTTVELGEGESFVIGGLVSRNVIANVDKVPGLADLPILGAFFKSVSYSKQDKELVIIATPRFVKPRAKNAPALDLPGAGAGNIRSNIWGVLTLPQPTDTLPGFGN